MQVRGVGCVDLQALGPLESTRGQAHTAVVEAGCVGGALVGGGGKGGDGEGR